MVDRERISETVLAVPSLWVVPLATVSVERLIAICQPASLQLPEANLQSKLGHIPLGSISMAAAQRDSKCLLCSQEPVSLRILTDLRTVHKLTENFPRVKA